MAAKKFLKKCQLFSALTYGELGQVESSVLEKQYEVGTTIFAEGDPANELLVLQEGKVVLQMTLPEEHNKKSGKVTVDIVTRNEIVSWSAMMEPYTYSLTAVCLQPVKALSISGNTLRWLLENNHINGNGLWTELIKAVTSKLEQTRYLLVSERLWFGGG